MVWNWVLPLGNRSQKTSESSEKGDTVTARRRRLTALLAVDDHRPWIAWSCRFSQEEMGRWVDGSRLFVSMIFSTYEIYISTVIPSHSQSPTCPTVFTVLGFCLKCLHEPLLAEELGGVVPFAMGYVCTLFSRRSARSHMGWRYFDG